MRVLWTDGSAVPNPGAGGYAVIDGTTREPVALGRGKRTTNIRMEGYALMAAIREAGTEPAKIYTDSEFWKNVLEKWAPAWARAGWVRKNQKPIQNLDIVRELYGLYNEHKVKLVWVRGHVGTELNERADEWANRARRGETFGSIELGEDPGELVGVK